MSETSESQAVGCTARAPIVVFFDLDGTLVLGQTQALLTRFLHGAGIVGRAFLLVTGIWFLAYKTGLVKVTQKSRDKGARVLKGLTEREVERLMDRFADEVLMPAVHPAASSALAEHLAEGHRVVVLSAALEPVVKSFCRQLGVTEYVGAPCEIHREGKGWFYTGRLSGPIPYGDEKARVAAGFMARWGAEAADCWAYADHDTDLALLRSVGHPVAVNPKPLLLATAERAGWPIFR